MPCPSHLARAELTTAKPAQDTERGAARGRDTLVHLLASLGLEPVAKPRTANLL